MGSVISLVELAEADYMLAYLAEAPSPVKALLGIVTTWIAGITVLGMRNDPTGGYWNKVLGFDGATRLSPAVIAEVLAFYRSEGIPAATLQIPPHALPPDWDDICRREGIRAGQSSVKMVRRAGTVELPRTDLRVTRIGEGDADAWAHVMCRGFGLPATALGPIYSGTVRPDSSFVGFGAWDGDELVATANLRINGSVAAFCGSSTLPRHRGRGAQSALNHARIEAANAAGCEWITSETWEEYGDFKNPSKHNMIRSGFKPVHNRTDWLVDTIPALGRTAIA